MSNIEDTARDYADEYTRFQKEQRIKERNDYINKSERRIKEKREKIEDLNYELDLLMEKEFKYLCSEIRYFYLGSMIILPALNYFYMMKSGKDEDGNKIDKRKKNTYKGATEYKILKKQIEKYLDINNIEIIDIINYNYDIGAEIRFKYNEHIFQLNIPFTNNMSYHEFSRVGIDAFKISLFIKDQKYHNFYIQIGSTFDEEELASIFKHGIEKYVNNEGSKEDEKLSKI